MSTPNNTNTPNLLYKEALDAHVKAMQNKPRVLFDAAIKVLDTDDFEVLSNFINLMTAIHLEAQKIEEQQTH